MMSARPAEPSDPVPLNEMPMTREPNAVAADVKSGDSRPCEVLLVTVVESDRVAVKHHVDIPGRNICDALKERLALSCLSHA
jgi:hypothetical protein